MVFLRVANKTKLERDVSVNITLKCSATSQDSNDENRSDVAMPPKTRPNISTLYCGECLVKQLSMYVTQ